MGSAVHEPLMLIFENDFRSLGLHCVQGNMNAAKPFKLVEELLECFSLHLDKVVVVIVTDGASLMVKFRKI